MMHYDNRFDSFHNKIRELAASKSFNDLVLFLNERCEETGFSNDILKSVRSLNKKGELKPFNRVLEALHKLNLFAERKFTKAFFFELTLKHHFKALTPLACKVVFEELQEKKNRFETMPVSVLDTPEMATLEFKDFILNAETDQKKAFLVHHNSINHYTAFFIKKMEDASFKIIITDSLRRGFLPALYPLYQALKESAMSDSSFEIYVYDEGRQKNDSTNCGTFALFDILQFAKHFDEILSWILLQKNSLESFDVTSEKGEPVGQLSGFCFNNPSPFLMKAMQSVSRIEAYDLENSESLLATLKAKNKIVEGKNRSIELLFRKIQLLVIEKQNLLKY